MKYQLMHFIQKTPPLLIASEGMGSHHHEGYTAAAACIVRTNNVSVGDVSLERNPKRTKRDNTNTNKRTLADHDDG